MPDPVPSRPVNEGALFDLELTLSIDVKVLVSTAEGSTTGGAMHEMLDVCVHLALGGTGGVDLPASDFVFKWDAGPPAPATDPNLPAPPRSTVSVDSVCDGGATCGSGVALEVCATQAHLCSLWCWKLCRHIQYWITLYLHGLKKAACSTGPGRRLHLRSATEDFRSAYIVRMFCC